MKKVNKKIVLILVLFCYQTISCEENTIYDCICQVKSSHPVNRKGTT